MDVLFYVVPGLVLAVALVVAFVTVRRRLRLGRAWRSGLTAEARCLRTFTTAYGGGESRVRTRPHHVYEFTTHDGRRIRFEQQDGPATFLEGDVVTVYYADGPGVVATAHRPGDIKDTVGMVAVLAFLGLVAAFCVGFMIMYQGMAHM